MLTRHPATALLAVGFLVLTACSDDSTTGSDTTTSTSSSTSSTSSTIEPQTPEGEAGSGEIDVTVVPDEMTLDYVNETLRVVNAALGDVTREAVGGQGLAADVQDRVSAVATDNYGQPFLGLVIRQAQGENVLPADPGDVVMTATEILLETDTCVAVDGTVDSSGIVEGGVASVPGVLTLVLADPGGPTAFKLDQVAAAGTAPDTLCA